MPEDGVNGVRDIYDWQDIVADQAEVPEQPRTPAGRELLPCPLELGEPLFPRSDSSTDPMDISTNSLESGLSMISVYGTSLGRYRLLMEKFKSALISHHPPLLEQVAILRAVAEEIQRARPPVTGATGKILVAAARIAMIVESQKRKYEEVDEEHRDIDHVVGETEDRTGVTERRVLRDEHRRVLNEVIDQVNAGDDGED